MITVAEIRKDTFNGTALPWTADITYDGVFIRSYQSGFKSMKDLVNSLKITFDMAGVVDYEINRVAHKDR
jgi:hypothetical protein